MISSVSNSRVKQVVLWQCKARERKKDGVFIAEGLKMFEEAPENWILETYISEKCLSQIQCAMEGQSRETEQESGPAGPAKAWWDKLKRCGYEEVSEEVYSKMSDTQAPQGILCVLKRPDFTLEQLLDRSGGTEPLLVVVEDLQDPGNLGTILRTGEGAGISGVLMTKDTVDIYNPKTIRATMGSIYRVPHIYIEDMPETIEKLQERGIRTYAAHLEGKTYYDTQDFCSGTAFLIGNEGGGLKRETADRAGNYVKIPMEGKVESLNAAIAASLFMYEAHRQRHS